MADKGFFSKEGELIYFWSSLVKGRVKREEEGKSRRGKMGREAAKKGTVTGA
jgi:hypothetical protein